MKNTLKYFFLTKLILLSFPAIVFAEPARLAEVDNIYDSFAAYIFPIAGFVAMSIFVYGGYMWMIGAGDPQKIKQAQGAIVWSIVGFTFIALLSLLFKSFFEFLGIA